MNIGLVGAPESGKSKLAEALSQKLEGKTHIIDDYVDEVGKSNDIAVGVEGSYISNLYVVLGRSALERKASYCGCYSNIISCGTLIESSVYATFNAMQANDNAEDQSQNWTRISNFMNILGSFYQDTIASPAFYDHLFVMPETTTEDDALKQIQSNLMLALNSFGYPYTVLESDEVDDQVKQITEFIEAEEVEHEVASVE